MDNKVSFLNSSIADIQSTIRAIDAKVGLLIILISFPLALISRVFFHIENILVPSYTWYLCVLIMLFFISWILAISFSIRTISAIDDPSTHIINSSGINGSYYAGDLYTLSIFDAFSNRDVLKASKDVQVHHDSIPDDVNTIAMALSFEQMKLVYIRDMKLNRIKWSIYFTYLWLVSGGIIYLISRYL